MANPINMQFPISRGAAGAFAYNEDTLEAVEDDLRILLLTNYGERPIHFDFGANLRSLIFEFQGEALNQAVKDRILSAVEQWMPFVKVVNVTVENSSTAPQLGPNDIHVKVEFTVGNLDVTKVLVQRIKT